MTRTRPTLFVIALTLCGLIGLPALAGDPPEGSPEWEELMNKISLLRNFKLVEALDLDEKTATRLAVYMKDKEEQRQDIATRKADVGKRIQQFVAAGGDDDKIAEDLLAEAMALNIEEHDFDVDLVKGLDKILSPSQQLKFVLVNHQFEREVQEMIREQREHRERMRHHPPRRPRAP